MILFKSSVCQRTKAPLAKESINSARRILPLVRAAFFSGYLLKPPVLFLDEPTSGVDPRTRREFWKHINAMTQNGVAVLVTTHFMEEAEYCDEIALVFQGGIIARGTPDELKGKAPGAAKNGGAADMTLEEAFIAYIEEVQRKGGHA